MPQLFDHELGQVVDVPDAQVGDALRSGRYTAEKGAVIPVIAPDGVAGTIDSSQAYEYLNAGFKFETPEQGEQRYLQEKYGNRELEAGLVSALSSSTFGLFDAAAAKLAPDSVETLKKLREFNPEAETVGEIAGYVLPALLTGGAALPAGLGAAIAKSAGQATAKGLAKKGIGTLGQKVADVAVRGAIEGAAANVGQTITESSLGDTELTAERLLMAAGTGAMFGAAGDAAFTLGGAGLRKAISATGKKIGIEKAVENLYERSTGNKATKWLGSTWAKLTSITSGADESTIKTVLANRAAATKPQSVIDDAAVSLWKAADAAQTSFDEISQEAVGINKLKNFAALVKRGNEGETVPKAFDAISEFISATDEMIQSGPGDYGLSADLKKLRTAALGAQNRLLGYLDDVGASNVDVFIELDNLKKDIYKRVDAVSSRKNLSSADFSTIRELVGPDGFGGRYEKLRQLLQDKELWGDAAAAQREINQLWVPFLKGEAYRNNFFVKFEQSGLHAKYRANDKAFNSLVRNIRSEESLDYEYLVNQAQTKLELIKKIGEKFDLDDDLAKKISIAQKATDEFLSTLSKTKDDVILINQLNELERIPNGRFFGALTGGAIGYAVAEEQGALFGAGAGIGVLSRPGQTIRQLASLERITGGAQSYVSSAAKKFLGDTSAKLSTRLPGAGALSALLGNKLLNDDNTESTRKTAIKVQELASNPDLIFDSLSNSLGDMYDYAPNVAGAMAQKASMTVAFLAQKAPKTSAPGYFETDERPSRQELYKFGRYLSAALTPGKIIADIAHGAASPEQIETLKALYPSIYSNIVADIQIELAQKPRRALTTAQKGQLAMLFGAPIDPSQQPSVGLAVSNMYAVTEAQQQPMAQSNSASRKSLLAQQNLTRYQRMETK